jgi:hypothetical protein
MQGQASMYAIAITPPWIIEELRRRREEQEERRRPRVELPIPMPSREREEDRPGSTVITIELWS